MAAYEIINAIGRIAHSQSQWEAVDIAKYKISILYMRYDTLRVTLMNNYTKEVGWLSLDDVDTSIPQDKTFKEYLEMIGDKSLPLKEGTLTLKKKGLLYKEAHTAGFKIYPVKSGMLPDDDFSRKYDYSDLFFKKEDVDYKDMYESCMITVNGFVHLTNANTQGLWVTDGYKTVRKRKKRCIGIISFENLGRLTYIPIKENMVSKLNDGIDYYREMVIDLDQDLKDKTIMIVIGGYLHVLDNDVFTRISNSAVKIRFDNIPLLERIHQSMDDLDLDYVFDKRYGETNVHLGYIQSDEFLKRYITSNYSFIVILDNPNVFKEISYPRKRGIPNSYLYHKRPNLPMLTRLGKFEEYLYKQDNNLFEIETADCQYHDRTYNRAGKLDKETYYDAGSTPTKRRYIADAYFMNLVSMI